MNAKPQQGIKKNEDLQATLKNGQEKSGKPTLPAAFPVLETGSRKELQITWNDFPDRDQLQELYTSYKHVIIKPPMICCDFCRHRQSFITGGIKENTGNGSDREKAVSRRFLPDIEEKSYRHRYHIHIIKPQNAPFSCFFFKHQRIRRPQIFSRTHFSRSTDFPSISAGQNESKRKDLKTHGHEWLFPRQA